MGFVQNYSLSRLVKTAIAIVVWEIFKKTYGGVAEIVTFFVFFCSSFLINCTLK
jgi:hypothetical protein